MSAATNTDSAKTRAPHAARPINLSGFAGLVMRLGDGFDHVTLHTSDQAALDDAHETVSNWEDTPDNDDGSPNVGAWQFNRGQWPDAGYAVVVGNVALPTPDVDPHLQAHAQHLLESAADLLTADDSTNDVAQLLTTIAHQLNTADTNSPTTDTGNTPDEAAARLAAEAAQGFTEDQIGDPRPGPGHPDNR